LNPIFEAALEIQRFCSDRGWPFCVIGGLAVQRWGEPRLARDVDVSLLTDWLDIEGVVQRQTALDLRIIWEELVPLLELKEDPSIEPRLRKLLG
jgi:hypothetical protein